MVDIKILTLFSLIVISIQQNSTSTDLNRCALYLGRQPLNNSECLNDKSFSGVTCCYVTATDNQGNTVRLCGPRITETLVFDPTEIFKAELAKYQLNFNSFSCLSQHIYFSLVILLSIIGILF